MLDATSKVKNGLYNVLTQLTGITESALHTYACFYKGALLLAPDAQSLSAYVDAVENGDVLLANLLRFLKCYEADKNRKEN